MAALLAIGQQFLESLEAYDLGVLYGIGARPHPPWLQRFMEGATHLGDLPVLWGLTLVAAIGFLRARRPRVSLVLLGMTLLSWGLSDVTKLVVQRPRPNVVWGKAPSDNRSFPSGHALGTMAVYAGLALVLSRYLPRWPARLLPAGAVGVALLVGMSRVYLGLHYPLDVLGGWLGGLALALTAWELTGPSVASRAA